MSAKSITEDVLPENIVDDLPSVSVEPVSAKESPPPSEELDLSKLAALRAKSQSKQPENSMSKPVAKKDCSLKFGVIGSGQGGGRLAETFFKFQYPAVAVNTAIQDLKGLNIPDSNKLLLEYGLGGASKDLEIGKAAAEQHRDSISALVRDKVADNCQVFVFCLSLGGGSGAGSCETIVSVLSEFEKPIIVIAALPMSNEDPQTKQNSLDTLSKLAKMAQNSQIANLIVVDNAKIETIYSNVSQMSFYDVANKAIVEPLDVLNALSSMPSSSKALDPMEFTKIMLDSSGCTVYGQMDVHNYRQDTALAEAIIQNLDGNLLATGFDLKQAKYVGVMFVASKRVWDNVPASSVNYGMALVNDQCGSPLGVFRGLYTVDSPEDVVKVYSVFSGVGLPATRVAALQKETQELMSAVKAKTETRSVNLTLDLGKEATVSDAQKVRDKIAAKNSTFGKFVGSTVVDRRK